MDSCETCGLLFKRHYRRKGIKQKFCSKKCRYASMYEVRTCKTCGAQYTRNRLSKKSRDFCSLSCTTREPCQLCGTTITGRITFQGKHKRFCSRRCATISNRSFSGEKNYVIRGFIQCLKNSGALACEECGESDMFCLEVHHKNHRRSDNRDNNLQVICSNCHSKHHRDKSASRMRLVQTAYFIFSRIAAISDRQS